MTHTYDDISRFRACSTLALALPVRCAHTLSLRAPRCLARAAALRLCCSGACSGVISGRKSIQARKPQRSAEAPGDHAVVGDACASSRSNVEGRVPRVRRPRHQSRPPPPGKAELVVGSACAPESRHKGSRPKVELDNRAPIMQCP